MNTSLFVGLCEDAGFDVNVGNSITTVYSSSGLTIAAVNEKAHALYWIDTYGVSQHDAVKAAEIVTPYAMTPIEDRE